MTGCSYLPIGEDVKLGDSSTSSCSEEGLSRLRVLHEEIEQGLTSQKNLRLEDAFNCDDTGRDGITVTFDSPHLPNFINVFKKNWDCHDKQIKNYIGKSYAGKSDVLQCASPAIVFNLEFEDTSYGDPLFGYAFPDPSTPD